MNGLTKVEFKNKFQEVLSLNVKDLTHEEKINYIYYLVTRFEIKNDKLRLTPNKGKSWTDDD